MKGQSILVVAVVVMSGCVSMMAPSPEMADSMGYVRQHKGQGVRHSLVGSEAELMDAAAKSFEGIYPVYREPHAVIVNASLSNISLAYAFYFYPSQAVNRTEVEALCASNWLSAEQVLAFQKRAGADFFPLAYLNTRLLAPDFDPNEKVGSFLALSVAGMKDSRALARKLIGKGANVDAAINELREQASRNASYLDKPANKRSYDEANAGVALLERLKTSAAQGEAEKVSEARFQEAARAYQAASVKPQLPEDARRFKVQGEDAAKNKRFEAAADLFGKALEIAPWWPEGHYNRAVILGELGQPDSAMLEMKRYLRLVPTAPNARAAQDKIYVWEGQAQ